MIAANVGMPASPARQKSPKKLDGTVRSRRLQGGAIETWQLKRIPKGGVRVFLHVTGWRPAKSCAYTEEQTQRGSFRDLSATIFACLIVLASLPARAEPRIALVITNQAYTQAGALLTTTHRDGDLIKAALEK